MKYEEKIEYISLMLGLKPLGYPYEGAFETDEKTDRSFSIFFNGLLEAEKHYAYPMFDSDWNWLHEVIDFINKL